MKSIKVSVMKNFTSPLSVLFFLLIISGNASATIIIAKFNKGNWLCPLSWDQQRVPQCGDTILIPENIKLKATEMIDFVKMQYLCEAIKVFVSGTLSLEKKALLNLPEGSEVIIDKLGKVTFESNKTNALKIDYQVLYLNTLQNIEGPTSINKKNAESIQLEKMEVVNYKETFLINWDVSKLNDFAYYELFKRDKHNNWVSIFKQKSFGNSEFSEQYKCIIKHEKYKEALHFKLNVVDLNGNVQTLNEFKYVDEKIERSNILVQISKTLFLYSTGFILSKVGK